MFRSHFIGRGDYYFYVSVKDFASDFFDVETFVKCFAFDRRDDAEKCHSYFSSLFEVLNHSDFDFVGDSFEISDVKKV